MVIQSNLDYPDLDYPDFFFWSQFGHEYLLATNKIRSHILLKTTALKSAVQCEDKKRNPRVKKGK